MQDNAEQVYRLPDAEQRFQAVFNAASDAMSLSDPDGIVVDANPAYFELYGYSAEEVLNQDFSIIFPEAGRPEARQMYRQVFTGSMPSLRFESTVMRKDGAIRFVDSRVGFIERDGERVLMLSVIRDVTERILAEQVLQKSLADLRRSNADLEQYAYVASHDLQEPLRMVISYMQLLKQTHGDALDQTAHEYIGFAVDGAARMKRMIDDILVYSGLKDERPAFTAFSSGGALQAALDNLQFRIADAGAVITRGDLPTITGSERQFVQLFQNLLSNALKFRGDRRPEIHVAAQRRDGEWLFSVSDNGIGIAADQLERIFQMFQRLHTTLDFPGTGIGLAISRKVVDYHGGRIWAESQPGDGTTFYFTVPASDDERGTTDDQTEP